MIATEAVTVSPKDWESIKATFLLIVNSTDEPLVREICVEAMTQMERMQGVQRRQDESEEV